MAPLLQDPLAAYLADLRARLAPSLVPDMDPLDGGAGARVLVLLEKPGPKVAVTGIISRDNPDPSARALTAFMAQARLPRRETLLWNVIPAWNGTIRVTGAEIRDGLAHLVRLLPLLPALDTVILVGKRAGRAAPLFEGSPLRVLASAHPSGQVRAAFPDRWAAIPGIWAQAAQVTDQ